MPNVAVAQANMPPNNTTRVASPGWATPPPPLTVNEPARARRPSIGNDPPNRP